MTDSIFLYTAILIITSLALLLVGVIILYLRLVRKFLSLREGEGKDLDPQAILFKAQSKSQDILEDAHRKASEIVGRAEKFLNAQEGKVSQELEKASKSYANYFLDSLRKVEEEAKKSLTGVPEEIKKVYATEVVNIRTTLEAQLAKAREDSRQIVLEAYKKAEAEVENYKKQRLNQIDESIIIILQEVARRVLSREINQEEHEKLVMKALEEAKRQHVFEAGEAQGSEANLEQEQSQGS